MVGVVEVGPGRGKTQKWVSWEDYSLKKNDPLSYWAYPKYVVDKQRRKLSDLSIAPRAVEASDSEPEEWCERSKVHAALEGEDSA